MLLGTVVIERESRVDDIGRLAGAHTRRLPGRRLRGRRGRQLAAECSVGERVGRGGGCCGRRCRGRRREWLLRGRVAWFGLGRRHGSRKQRRKLGAVRCGGHWAGGKRQAGGSSWRRCRHLAARSWHCRSPQCRGQFRGIRHLCCEEPSFERRAGSGQHTATLACRARLGPSRGGRELHRRHSYRSRGRRCYCTSSRARGVAGRECGEHGAPATLGHSGRDARRGRLGGRRAHPRRLLDRNDRARLDSARVASAQLVAQMG